MEKRERLKMIISHSAAALCAAAIAVSAFGIKVKTPALSDGTSPFSGTPGKISALISSDTGFAQALNKDEGTKASEEEALDSSPLPEDSSSDGGEKENTQTSLTQREPYNTYSNGANGSQNSDTRTDGSADYSSYGSGDGGDDSKASDSDSDSAGELNKTADDAERAETPGFNPTEGNETDKEYFTTSITDGETVDSAEYSFTITHLREDLTVKRIDVSVNGTRFPWNGTVMLSEENGGENKIRVAATYVGEDGTVYSAYKDYTVWLKSGETETETQIEPDLQTDLYSHTRSNAELEFFAYMSGEAENVRLTVYCKNTKLTADGNYYSCSLDMGINTIRIRAKYEYNGEQLEINREYEIKLIAETTDDTAPYLAYHNVPDTVRGSLYTLDLAPCDFNGNTLYYNNLYVRLNGSALKYSWDGEYTSYLLELSAGENTLDIRVTDGDGRYTDYSFVINCLAAQDGEIIGYAGLEADADVLGLGVLLPEIQIEIRQGESAARSILRALEEAGFTVESTGDVDSGYYIARIAGDGMAEGAEIPNDLYAFIEADSDVRFTSQSDTNSLGERDFTTASGWMVSVNGHYTSYGMSDIHLKDGDKIRLRFTLAYGKDIGGYVGGGSNYEVCY